MNNENCIGYKNPPKETQFKKGQSGNKNGRPKGRKKLDINGALQKELMTNIVTKDGQRMTKIEVVAKQIVNKAVTGDLKSAKVIIPMIQRANDTDLSTQFCDKLIKENFINQQDMKDFVYNNKYLSINKRFTATDKIDYGIFQKKTMALEAVKTMFSLYHINLLVTTVLLSNDLVTTIERETGFWDGVKNTFDILNTSEKTRLKIIKDLEKTREYDMPTDDMYQTAQVFQDLSYKNIFVTLKELINMQKNRVYYEDQKRYWFSEENQSKFYKYFNKETLDDIQTRDELFYDKYFMSGMEDVEINLDALTIEKSIALMKWYKGKKESCPQLLNALH